MTGTPKHERTSHDMLDPITVQEDRPRPGTPQSMIDTITPQAAAAPPASPSPQQASPKPAQKKNEPFVVHWRDSFRSDIPQVDKEHHHLFNLVAMLNVETINVVLDELLDYVAEHFQHEEELMRLSGYPDIEAHIAQHVALTNSVASVVTATPVWTPENINKLRQFANKWLVGHILGTDLKFARWYRENKVDVYMDEEGHFQKVKVSFWQRLMGKK